MKRLDAAGGMYLGPEEGACDFDVIADQLRALGTTKHEFKTVVIDSITKVWYAKWSAESERLGDKDVFGAAKKAPIRAMRRLISLVDRIDLNVWFVAQETAEWQTVKGERQEVGRVPDVWDKLGYELDLCLRVEKFPAMRAATVWKSRLIGFPDNDRFDLQRDGKDLSYEAISSRHAKDAIEAEAKPIELVSTEAVVEIKRLLEAVRVSEEDVDRLLTKAKAERVEDLPREHGEKMLTWLNAKVTKRNGG